MAKNQKGGARTAIIILAISIAAIAAVIFLSGPDRNWRVTPGGVLEYSKCTPDYQSSILETRDNYTLYEVSFTSRCTITSTFSAYNPHQYPEHISNISIV
uniref:Uncharacterized protein n=1 Tax=Candidatus Methanophaga sp. ANME-1 ERB7 TaxID=2759913 RepID=A0A7G9Z6M0_9EURY|nr:hypothetical protein JGNPCJAK_00006 [Methanosarcinales archaeon ANME-1 ERB7]